MLNRRWYTLKPHNTQARLYWDDRRFKLASAGRRSGKTELAKRCGVREGLAKGSLIDNWWGVFAAPTRDQAKQIFWEDVKALTPKDSISRVNESDLRIRLINGADLQVVGLDRPERIEGRALDWIVVDEYGNCKPEVWNQHIRPALSTLGRPGSAWLIGVPEGRNHYWDLWVDAMSRGGEWGTYTWFSSDILEPEEIASAKRSMDLRSYQQEYEGSFLDFEGRIYYTFSREDHCKPLRYHPELPIVFCFDFNRSPGVAVVCQEVGGQTHVIAEVWKETDSNTEIVCRRLVDSWGRNGQNHAGEIYLYGDATGGAKGSQSVMGSDWAIIRDQLTKEWDIDRLHFMTPEANPRVRVRTNAVNSRLRSADGVVSVCIDPVAAEHLVKDLEGVTEEELEHKGSAGMLTHISDAFGYYIVERWPIEEHSTNLVAW